MDYPLLYRHPLPKRHEVHSASGSKNLGFFMSSPLFALSISIYWALTNNLFSHSVMSNSLWPHGLQHARLPCLSPSPGASSNSYHWVSDTILLRPALTSRISESGIWQEKEKQDTRIQRKARIGGPTPLQGEGAETESTPALLYFQPWRKKYAGS